MLARYAISAEGAEGLRTLSAELQQSMLAIADANKSLQRKISSEMDTLGIYGIDVWNIALHTKDLLDSAADEVGALVESLQNKASDIEEIMGITSLAGSGQNSDLGATNGSQRPNSAVASGTYLGIRDALEGRKVEHKKIEFCGAGRSTEDIVACLGGGDRTKGSCSSLALAYVGNRAGYDVLDFRDGDSREFFSDKGHIAIMARLPGVDSKIITGCDSLECADRLLGQVEPGKEYYLATGQHAAIVRLKDGHYEYLELQSASDNGWHILHDRVLCDRFGCDIYSSDYPNVLIDVESLGKSEEFLDILGYINTKEDSQIKGASGHAK